MFPIRIKFDLKDREFNLVFNISVNNTIFSYLILLCLSYGRCCGIADISPMRCWVLPLI